MKLTATITIEVNPKLMEEDLIDWFWNEDDDREYTNEEYKDAAVAYMGESDFVTLGEGFTLNCTPDQWKELLTIMKRTHSKYRASLAE